MFDLNYYDAACDDTACDDLTCYDTACDDAACDDLTCDDTACDDLTCNEITPEELSPAEAEEQAWISEDDIHPYKSRYSATRAALPTPRLTRFNTYLLNHFGADIVDEINGMLYDGELAAICGVDGFYSQRLTHDKCRIDPRMSFWRLNKYEFTADLVVYLRARAYSEDMEEMAAGPYGDRYSGMSSGERSATEEMAGEEYDGECDNEYCGWSFGVCPGMEECSATEDVVDRECYDEFCGPQSFTLYVTLDFCVDELIDYHIASISLKKPERNGIKLDDYLIPILNLQEVNGAAEDLWREYMPEALRDYRLLDPFRLADRMGLSVAYHKLYRNHKTKSVLYWFDSEVEVSPDRDKADECKETPADEDEASPVNDNTPPAVVKVPADSDDSTPPAVVRIPAGTILINENAVHKDRARLNVYHECFHDEYHWLFYRLQEMHNNDLRNIKKTRKIKKIRKPNNQGKGSYKQGNAPYCRGTELRTQSIASESLCSKPDTAYIEPKNPLTILEWEAKQGSRALMMPECIMRPMIEKYKDEEQEIRARAGFTNNHPGHVFQGVGCAIHGEMGIPKYLVRGRMIQLGYWQAQGVLNYIQEPPTRGRHAVSSVSSPKNISGNASTEGHPLSQANPTSGHYIPPFTFSRESCPSTAHTFIISPEESFRLYEKNEEYRARLDTGNYVYVDGHICLNDPAFIIQTSSGPIMTNWANRHVDECCLRFENVYEVDENYEFRLNSINSDEEYNRHYIDFAAQGKEISAKEATEQQSDIIASLPTKPGEALKALMKMSGNVTIEQMAERALVSSGTVKNWRKEEYVYDSETAVRIIVALHLPPWISTWFLQTCGIVLQFRGLHMMYRNIIVCHYMDTMEEVNALIEAAGFDRMVEFY